MASCDTKFQSPMRPMGMFESTGSEPTPEPIADPPELPENYLYFPEIEAFLPTEEDGWQCAVTGGIYGDSYVLVNDGLFGADVMYQLERIDSYGAYAASSFPDLLPMHMDYVESGLRRVTENYDIRMVLEDPQLFVVGANQDHKGQLCSGKVENYGLDLRISGAMWRSGQNIYYMYFLSGGANFDAAQGLFEAMLKGFLSTGEMEFSPEPTELVAFSDLEAYNVG